ncbi:GCN5 family acetyltransferase [Bordetella sp. H567]|uniref:bifunctional acetate--CoA ligase family protein/GNAT family N-acetyltransferase n=1 Tax=Bordetella sp. H567 TaxID=1697043 RepID=UPI00081C8831|nr:acetate--CoA ligase family protein [Bordetella sp. H567]AOB31426.1 GCN5 family acetyltransferase [Bordetella sp. H567]
MSIRNLRALFQPASVAIVGASERPCAVGAHVLSNVRAAGYAGKIYAVNPKHCVVRGIPCYPDIASLPAAPDLAVICTPAATVPGLIAELGAKGTKAAVVLSAGLSAATVAGGALRAAMLAAARPHLLRILGPNCLGVLIPGLGLNASFAPAMALRGRLAFVSQSGALATAVLDWSNSRNIGFSHFITLGDSADVDLGDVLDYLSDCGDARAILLYVESVTAARKFMSAARRAARNKPVVVVKAGRAAEGARAAATHTGALAGSDIVYDAAIRRAGMLRVDTTDELFGAVETLARARPLRGDRLAIMTNGGGAGVMATDALVRGGGTLAPLDPATLDALNAVLPATWSHANPVDIVGDAPVSRYVEAMDILLRDRGSDAVLFLHAPTAIVPSEDIAAALQSAIVAAPRNVFASWLGGDAVSHARKRFRRAGIPTYDTPEQAVDAFLYVVEYQRNQALLLETPSSDGGETTGNPEQVRAIVAGVLAAGRTMLADSEAKAVLAAYGIPVLETRIAADAEQAVACAAALGYPVAVKILSSAISHKSDAGGVALDLETADQVRGAVRAIVRRTGQLRPDASIEGFIVQKMLRRPHAHELIVGASVDAVFGPIVLFGHGGTAVEVVADRAVGLVPLNEPLARDMVARTRVAALLAGYRDQPAIDHVALYRVLMQVSRLMCDIPEIVSLDINPLLADAGGVVAVDARVGVARHAGLATDRLSILPYPAALEERMPWGDSTILIRPARPDDEARYARFFTALTPDDVRRRFFGMIGQLQHRELARMVQLDYDREMAFLAIRKDADGAACVLGEARAIADPDLESAEFALMVRSDLKNRGLGTLLLTRLIRYCAGRGMGSLWGTVMGDNVAMLELARRCGFGAQSQGMGSEVLIRLALNSADIGPVQPLAVDPVYVR